MHQRAGARRVDFKSDPTAGSVARYAQHEREFVGCHSFGIQFRILRFSVSCGGHHTRGTAQRKTVRGEGNSGRATDRGKDACEFMGPSLLFGGQGLSPAVRASCPSRMYSHQDLPGNEQKRDPRQTAPGEDAILHEAKMEK